MRKKSVVAAALLVAALAPSPAFAWGAVAHRYIMRRAVELLPPEIKPFFEHNRDELVLRANDPDLWRVVGFEDEPPNHQIDFGVDDYGPYPFVALPGSTTPPSRNSASRWFAGTGSCRGERWRNSGT
jgi:hypothetical protein